MTAAELNDGALYAEIHRLVTNVLEGPAEGAAEQLAAFLESEGEQAQQIYASYMHETQALREAGFSVSQLLPNVGDTFVAKDKPTQRATRSGPSRWWVTFGALAASVSLFAFWSQSPTGQPANVVALDAGPVQQRESAAVATLVRTTGVEWRGGDDAIGDMSRLHKGQRIQIERGQLEILFDTGVELVVAGQADAVIESSSKVVGRLGAFSARVSERGRGFTIDTPATSVIDLGTEFGVKIESSGKTQVAVFKGEVDLQFTGAKSEEVDADKSKSMPTERLRTGEAVQIETGGSSRRLVAIDSEAFPIPGPRQQLKALRPVLITDVRDNIRNPANKKFYKLVKAGMFDDARAFVDRDHQWNGIDSRGIPAVLRGADYIMPFNDDKFTKDYELTVSLSGPCRLFVLFDNNMRVPSWLSEQFKDTGVDIGLDQAYSRYSPGSSLSFGGGMSIDDTFSVWERTIDRPSDIEMGDIDKPSDKDKGWNMYAVAAAPLSE